MKSVNEAFALVIHLILLAASVLIPAWVILHFVAKLW